MTALKSPVILEKHYKIFTEEIMYGMCSPNHVACRRGIKSHGGVRAYLEGDRQC